ncbi:MAG: ABC transporter permease [Gemmatimonadaceae bacterium]
MLRLRAIFRRRSLDDDMQAEMRQHLERTTERLIARGMPPADARLAALREFGNVTVLQEESRDARGARWMDELSGDLRFAGRYFGRHKATVAIIVTVIALATGANMMIFSIFQSEFVRPAPTVPDNPAHVRIWAQERATRTARFEQRGFSYAELSALAEHRDILRDVAAWTKDDVVLQAGDSTGARAVSAQFVTPNYFAVLGVGLVAGQGMIRQAADEPDMSAVMSYELATQLYGTAAKAIGLTIRVNEVPLHVVGVTPPRFQGAVRHMDGSALWIPLSARTDIDRVSARWLADEPALSLFGRLAPHASHERATALARQVIASTLPDSASRIGMTRTADVRGMQDLPPGEGTSELLIAFTAIAMIGLLILLVAWMNVSSLMVAAAVGRRHEIAVRLSLGASRTRLIRQLVTESTVLALAGGTIGLVLAWWELTYMAKTEIDAVEILPDLSTFAFTLGIALATGILFGLSPALHATRDGVATALRDSKAGSAGRSRLQRNFVAVQIMLSQPLLVLIGVMLALLTADYRPLSPEMSRHVIDIQFRPLERTGLPPAQRREAVDALVPRIGERPEVFGAVPASEGFAVRGVVAPERRESLTSDTSKTIVNVEGAAPGWFSLVDVPIVLGRDVSSADTAATDYPVVIGSDLARALWGDAYPIGRALASPPLPGLEQDSITMSVVGVYDAGKRLPGMSWNGYAARGNMNNTVTRVFTARGKRWRHDEVLVRTRGPAEPLLPELQRYIRHAAPSLPVSSIRTLAQQDDSAYHETLRTALLAGAGGALALLLASLGLYGVVSLAVQQRTREIGIRIAVGAAPTQVARMFLASGVRVSMAALLFGLPLSIAALRIGLSQGIILAPDVNVWPIGVGIALTLLAVASAATWLPARRAARVDPSTTLRVD